MLLYDLEGNNCCQVLAMLLLVGAEDIAIAFLIHGFNNYCVIFIVYVCRSFIIPQSHGMN